MLTYDEWYEENENWLWQRVYESGADREGGFNPEADFEIEYSKYCEQFAYCSLNSEQWQEAYEADLGL